MDLAAKSTAALAKHRDPFAAHCADTWNEIQKENQLNRQLIEPKNGNAID
jgi:hypothetical protein